MNTCIICYSSCSTFNKEEHIIPQGLVKSRLILKNVVCDICNERFGRTLDSTLTGSIGKKAFNSTIENAIENAINNMQTHCDRDILENRAQCIKVNTENTWKNRGGQSSTAILTTGKNAKSGEHALLKFDLEPNNLYVNYGKRYLFSLAKIRY